MSSDPDWDLFRTFLAVLEEGSLSGAARRLGLAQPTAARHVEALERAVGADLFLRGPRGLVPTGRAEALRPYAASIASTAAALLRAARGEAGAVAGTVRVSASAVMGVERLPPILADLRRRHPGLAVELVLSDALSDLGAREADVAVRQAEPAQGSLVARRLPPDALGLHAHRAYLARRGAPAVPADLAGHDVVGFDRPTPFDRALSERFPDLARGGFAFRADSHLAQLAAVRAGLGIGFVQAGIARRDPNLVPVLPGVVEVELGLWIVMHENLRGSARCRAVFDALVAGLA